MRMTVMRERSLGLMAVSQSDSKVSEQVEESDSAIWSNNDSTDTDGNDIRQRKKDTPNRWGSVTIFMGNKTWLFKIQ